MATDTRKTEHEMWMRRASEIRSDVERYEAMQREYKRAGDDRAWLRISSALVGMRDMFSLCEERYKMLADAMRVSP